MVTRMREQSLDTPDIARLVRGANAGHGRAWGRLVDRDAGLIWASTPQFKQAAQLRGAAREPGIMVCTIGEAFHVSPRVCLGRDARDAERLDRLARPAPAGRYGCRDRGAANVL